MEHVRESRYKRIARDMEKLPCELHDDILNELEFGQIIRLSREAGPLLTWSITNNKSPWGQWFTPELVPKWQRFLEVTDMVRKHCHDPWYFSYWEFLKFRNAEWKVEPPVHVQNYPDEAALTRSWMRDLKAAAYHRYELVLVRGYRDHVTPYVEQLKRSRGDQHAEIVTRVHDFCENDRQRSKVSDLSLDELVIFLEAMQVIRTAESETLAAELSRLADLYDAHPTRLKMPFAPQSPRPNWKHIPNQLRVEARKLVRWGKNNGWRIEPFKYRFIYDHPALVPYEWCKQLLLRAEVSDCPEEIMASYRLLRKGTQPVTSGKTDALDDITEGFSQLGIKEAVLTHKRAEWWDGHRYSPSKEAALDWLEALCKVVAWMEEKYPDIVQEIRGNGRTESESNEP